MIRSTLASSVLSLLACMLLGQSGLTDSNFSMWYGSSPGNLSAPSGYEFRGSYADMNLWVSPRLHFNTGEFWLIEYTSAEQRVTEKDRAIKLGLAIELESGNSLLMKGHAPERLGYDTCGGEPDKTVISIPEYELSTKLMQSYVVAASDSDGQDLEKDPNIEALLSHVSSASLLRSNSKLTGFGTRNSRAVKQITAAVDWVESQLSSYGFTPKRGTFSLGSKGPTIPQVCGELTGTDDPSKIVVVGAHLDSINSDAISHTDSAPGADDNGSGSSAVIEFAKVVKESGVDFSHTLLLCLFTGEEQGLIGSRALAKKAKDEGLDIVGMVNADMIGYRMSGSPPTLAFTSRMSDPSLTSTAKRISALYVPELNIGDTTGCCTDSQSYHENGYRAVAFFETFDLVNPNYHRGTDQTVTIDEEQLLLQSRAFIATASFLAGAGDATPPILLSGGISPSVGRLIVALVSLRVLLCRQ